MDELNYKPAAILLVEDDDIDALSDMRAFSKLKIAVFSSNVMFGSSRTLSIRTVSKMTGLHFGLR